MAQSYFLFAYSCCIGTSISLFTLTKNRAKRSVGIWNNAHLGLPCSFYITWNILVLTGFSKAERACDWFVYSLFWRQKKGMVEVLNLGVILTGCVLKHQGFNWDRLRRPPGIIHLRQEWLTSFYFGDAKLWFWITLDQHSCMVRETGVQSAQVDSELAWICCILWTVVGLRRCDMGTWRAWDALCCWYCLAICSHFT